VSTPENEPLGPTDRRAEVRGQRSAATELSIEAFSSGFFWVFFFVRVFIYPPTNVDPAKFTCRVEGWRVEGWRVEAGGRRAGAGVSRGGGFLYFPFRTSLGYHRLQQQDLYLFQKKERK